MSERLSLVWLVPFCVGYFLLAGMAINVAYHRVLSHRSLTLNRWLERLEIEDVKQSGKALKEGLIKLRGLRNGVAQEMGYHDYFALQVASYGMTTDEMVRLMLAAGSFSIGFRLCRTRLRTSRRVEARRAVAWLVGPTLP